MIKYALICAAAHKFEAWFADSATFDRQAAAGLVSCPVCGDVEVRKALMAPAVNSAPKPPPAPEAPPPPVPQPPTTPDAARRLVEQQLRALREHVERSAEYVGDDFPDEARAIHEGDARARAIYGESTPEETQELLEEGVPIAPVPWITRKDDS